MPTINITAGPDHPMSTIDRLIRVAGGLNPTVSGPLPPDQLIQRLLEYAPTVGRSEQQPNGFFKIDLGALRMMWVVCYDQIGSCVIFFVTHSGDGYGPSLMVDFIDELRNASDRAGFGFGALSGPMHEAEPDICRILAHGSVA